MLVHKLLHDRRAEIVTQMSALKDEMTEIDRMLGHNAPLDGNSSESGIASPLGSMGKEAQIMAALAKGHARPARIKAFLEKELGYEVKAGSIRTSLFRMKKAGKLSLGDGRWTIVDG